MKTLRAVTHFNQTFFDTELILLIQHSLLKQVFRIELSDRRPRKSLCPRRVLIQSDWISSNTLWFPARDKDIDPNEYWYLARHQAKVAVKQAGLFQSKPTDTPAQKILKGHHPRPLQDWAICAELEAEPALAFIEDTTGAGKTEAAFILAKRLSDAGLGKGVFVGPPVERQQASF
ncbi:MAG: hypothetical protein ACPHI0_05560 [Paracoccaceae bacterium]